MEDEADYFDNGCVHGAEVDECIVCNPSSSIYVDAELRGKQWPRDAAEAAGPIPEELWEISLVGED